MAKSESSKVLARLIKRFDCNVSEDCMNGYETKDGTLRDWYMTNKEWEDFLKKMQNKYPTAYRQYMEADGGELLEKRGRYGLYPPKMASYGSSSRMMYELFKDEKDFHFEQQLCTTMGGNPANLDGYVKRGNIHIYFEAKRLEIYGSHKKVVRDAYKELFKYLNIECSESVDDCFIPTYNKIKYFDFKQVISHILGIANKFLCEVEKSSIENFTIQFYYLIYNPIEIVDNGLSNNCITKRQRNFIVRRYKDIVHEINNIDFKCLWCKIVDYLSEKQRVSEQYRNRLHEAFTFECVDQNFRLPE